MKLETLCEDIYNLNESQEKLFNPQRKPSDTRPDFNNFVTVFDDVQTSSSLVNQSPNSSLRNKSVRLKKGHTIDILSPTRQQPQPRMRRQAVSDIQPQKWNQTLNNQFEIQEEIKAKLLPRQAIFQKIFKGEAVDQSQQFQTITAYSPTRRLKQLKLNRDNLVHYSQFMLKKKEGQQNKFFDLQDPPQRQGLLKKIKVNKCYTINESELEWGSPTFNQTIKSSTFDSLQLQDNNPASAEDEDIRKITEQTSQQSLASICVKLAKNPSPARQRKSPQLSQSALQREQEKTKRLHEASQRASRDLRLTFGESTRTRVAKRLMTEPTQASQLQNTIKLIKTQLKDRTFRTAPMSALGEKAEPMDNTHQEALSQRSNRMSLKSLAPVGMFDSQESKLAIIKPSTPKTSAEEVAAATEQSLRDLKIYPSSAYDLQIATSLQQLCLNNSKDGFTNRLLSSQQSMQSAGSNLYVTSRLRDLQNGHQQRKQAAFI